MPLACIHTHTIFCDGSDDIETCCRSAFAKGLACLGFSSHAPMSKKTGLYNECNIPEEKMEDYINEVIAAKKRWEGKLPVYLGLEVDFIENLTGPADTYYHELGLDFLIGSVHYVVPPKGEPFTVDDKLEAVEQGIREGYGGDPLGMIEAYLNAEIAMIRAGGFDVLGHPDLVKKNNSLPGGTKNRFFTENEIFYREKTSAIAAIMAGTGIPAEINTGGINRNKTKDCYPSLPFLKLFREQGVPMLINADAHKAEHLDGYYNEAKEAMLAAGYAETLIFQGRRNGKPVWKKEKLRTVW